MTRGDTEKPRDVTASTSDNAMDTTLCSTAFDVLYSVVTYWIPAPTPNSALPTNTSGMTGASAVTRKPAANRASPGSSTYLLKVLAMVP